MSSKKRKKSRQVVKKQKCLNDEIIFTEIAPFLSKYNVLHVNDITNVYNKHLDKGCDRLYVLCDNNNEYLHLSPHVYSWHFDVPSEVMYATLCLKEEVPIVPPLKGYCISADGEVISLYSPAKPLQLAYKYGNLNTESSLREICAFYRRCGDNLKKHGVFPTVFNPKRIYYDGASYGFVEAGHFQNCLFRVNEPVRIYDIVYSHSSCHPNYTPINQLRTPDNAYKESLCTGLLDFFSGSIAFLYFVIYGMDPTINSKLQSSTTYSAMFGCNDRCKASKGICEGSRSSDPQLKDLFHKFYCQDVVQSLPSVFKVITERKECTKEVLRRYYRFVNSLEEYINCRFFRDPPETSE